MLGGCGRGRGREAPPVKGISGAPPSTSARAWKIRQLTFLEIIPAPLIQIELKLVPTVASIHQA
jgi:hypothetical protein